MKQQKYIFITGGVVSGIGKGLTTSSLGTLFKARGLVPALMKFDPYLNMDAGTMNPFQHGEVFVTDDGAETDLDLGHYERFIDIPLSRAHNGTTGQIYQTVISQERHGDYLGASVQPIPHITNEIKDRIKAVATHSQADVIIAEIGGTVGDIENEVYLEAIRQFRRDVGAENVCYIHVTKIDYVYPSDEPKTKPTQQSVRLLHMRGIQPDVLVVRCKDSLSRELREKIALFCDLVPDDIISAKNADHLYGIPLSMEQAGLCERVSHHLSLPTIPSPQLEDWKQIALTLSHPRDEVRIAMVGKYVEHADAYLSVHEALIHGGIAHQVRVKVIPVDSETLEHNNLDTTFHDVDGILVPGGFGLRGIEGKIKAIQYAREHKIPFLGLCLGLQCATIEFARHVCNIAHANSTEFDPSTPDPVITMLESQKDITHKGGTMRLGAYDAHLTQGSLVHSLYKKETVSERHRHRYEVNPAYHEILHKNGYIISGISPDGTLVEFCELPRDVHPFFVGTQAHPEFTSRPTRPSPLFSGFVQAVLSRASLCS
ncbi:MAG: CTP synthase [Patescibacteria group bacterium]